MKRITATILCLVFVLALCSCNGQNTDSTEAAATSDQQETENSLIDNNIVDSAEMMTVKTSFTDLSYPKKWEKKVKFTVTDAAVQASCGDVKLFSLYFNDKKGDKYGTLIIEGQTLTLSYELYDINEEESNFDELCAMQDDINVIFQCLIDEGKLSEA